MKLRNTHKKFSERETVICVHDMEKEAYVYSEHRSVVNLLRKICEGPSGRIVREITIKGESVGLEAAIDKRHISINPNAYSKRSGKGTDSDADSDVDSDIDSDTKLEFNINDD